MTLYGAGNLGEYSEKLDGKSNKAGLGVVGGGGAALEHADREMWEGMTRPYLEKKKAAGGVSCAGAAGAVLAVGVALEKEKNNFEQG